MKRIDFTFDFHGDSTPSELTFERKQRHSLASLAVAIVWNCCGKMMIHKNEKGQHTEGKLIVFCEGGAAKYDA
jgi:hypothetical protein